MMNNSTRLKGKETGLTGRERTAVIYVRTANKDSDIGAQLEVCKAHAAKNGMEVCKIYCDEGVSGLKLDNQVALQQMSVDMDNDNFDTIIIKDLSRISRNFIDVDRFITLIAKKGISINYTHNEYN